VLKLGSGLSSGQARIPDCRRFACFSPFFSFLPLVVHDVSLFFFDGVGLFFFGDAPFPGLSLIGEAALSFC